MFFQVDQIVLACRVDVDLLVEAYQVSWLFLAAPKDEQPTTGINRPGSPFIVRLLGDDIAA
jgi:hypothetical protein